MASKSGEKSEQRTYYVRGSGWVPVPESRLAEIPRVVREHHERESRAVLALVRHGTPI